LKVGFFSNRRREPKQPKPALDDTHVGEIARLAATGDTSATARLLRIVAPEMLRVVRGVMGPYSSDVDDALQQSLVALIQALPSFRGECAPTGYACRIAFRTALGMRKRSHLARSRYDSSTDADLFPDSDAPGALSDARRRTEIVRDLLDRIPAEQAEALAMRTMLGWSIEEIAQASGAPINTVRSRLRLAKEALRRNIEADPSLADELGVGR
jgi:RNA polymerase sigma-70 factor (ECF subfamily)